MRERIFKNVDKFSDEEPVTERCGYAGSSDGDIDFYVKTKDTSHLVAWVNKDGHLVLGGVANSQDVGLVVGECGYPMVLLSCEREAYDIKKLITEHEQAEEEEDDLQSKLLDVVNSRKELQDELDRIAPSDDTIAEAEQRGRDEMLREAVYYLETRASFGTMLLRQKYNLPETEAKP